MTKQEIKQMVDDMIEGQVEESGLVKAEVLEPTMLSFVYMYYDDIIELKDLCMALNYLGYPYDEFELEKGKLERNSRKEKGYANKTKQES